MLRQKNDGTERIVFVYLTVGNGNASLKNILTRRFSPNHQCGPMGRLWLPPLALLALPPPVGSAQAAIDTNYKEPATADTAGLVAGAWCSPAPPPRLAGPQALLVALLLAAAGPPPSQGWQRSVEKEG